MSVYKSQKSNNKKISSGKTFEKPHCSHSNNQTEQNYPCDGVAGSLLLVKETIKMMRDINLQLENAERDMKNYLETNKKNKSFYNSK
nr:ORF4 [Bracoviriform inaniti]